jgi:hypothetical protein
MGLLPLVLTACSSSATSSTSTTTATTRSLCTEVQPAQIAAATGLKVSPAQGTATKTTLTCTYKGTDLSKSVIILYGIDVTSAEFTSQAKKANAAHGPITHVSHLGDAAYYFTVSAPGRRTITTLVLVHGQAEIVITSTASVGHLVDLATQILTIFSAKA